MEGSDHGLAVVGAADVHPPLDLHRPTEDDQPRPPGGLRQIAFADEFHGLHGGLSIAFDCFYLNERKAARRGCYFPAKLL